MSTSQQKINLTCHSIIVDSIIKYCCLMTSQFKSRLRSIVNGVRQKNKVASLLQRGQEGQKQRIPVEKDDHFEMNSEQLRQAQMLFNNPLEEMGKSLNKIRQKEKKMSEEKIDEDAGQQMRIKSILKQEKMIGQDSEKRQKSVSFYEQGKPIYLIPLDKKWNDKIQNQKKGKFEPHEQKILCDAVGQFLACNQIEFDQFKKMISDGDKGILRKERLFKLLSNVLPERSPESCYKFILRQFHILNHQGPWTQEEVEKLLALVDKFGRKWKLIAKEMNRTSDNVYDKYRSLGEEGLQQRVKHMWKIRELIVLLTQIQSQTKLSFLNPKVKQVLKLEKKHDDQEEKDLKIRTYNTKNFVFHNIQVLRGYIDAKQIKSVNIETIKWKFILKELPSKTLYDCRNKFVQILQILFRNNQDLDEILVSFLEKQNVQEQARIDWKKWHQKKFTPEEGKNRFMIMKKLIEGRSRKPFSVILQEMRAKLNRQKDDLI